MKLPNLTGEKSFTLGVILTVMFLYSASIYNVTASEKEKLADNQPQESLASDSRNQALDEGTKILRVLNVNESGLFRPINTGEALWVPGAECTITNFNLAPDGSLYGMPKDCTFALRGER